MSSSRLPGKVLKKLSCGETLIGLLLSRIQVLANNNIEIIVATSDSETDDILVDYLNTHFKWVKIFRGSLNNVIERYYQAAEANGVEIIVRITADCPFTDPNVISEMLELFEKSDFDYLANTMPPEKSTFSDGFDVEIFKKSGLARSMILPEITDKDREHVTFLFWNSKHFNIGNFENVKSPNFQFKLSVDSINDFNLIDTIVKNIGVNSSYSEIEYFINSDKNISKINSDSKKNSGWSL
jgi:spore coat polysaccharide biosynthesis protein SpsF